MTDDGFDPDWVSPPGDTIRDILEERHTTPYAFAPEIGLTFEQMQDLLCGRERLTPAIAAMLAHKLGSTTTFWLRREEQYRKTLQRLKHPHQVRFELPDGGGVILEPVCVLCKEPMRGVLDLTAVDAQPRPHDWGYGGIKCPICDRSFCAEACFSVHLNARDQFDSQEAIDAFKQSAVYDQTLDQASRVVLDTIFQRPPDQSPSTSPHKRWRRKPKETP